MFKKNLAFTLAETLIVIAIIGVVAALTLPNLNSSTADKETVTKVKKIYAGLTEAIDRAQAVYGPFDTWFNGIPTDDYPKRAKDRITEFMKVSKDCGQDEGCWSTADYCELDGSCFGSLYEYDSDYNYFVNLADGTSLSFYVDAVGHEMSINVDIDGPNKGKTTLGKDLFRFDIYNTPVDGVPARQLIPDYEHGNWVDNFFTSYPTAWIITNDNADYLKATCAGSGVCTCPDGAVLNWTNKTSCN